MILVLLAASIALMTFIIPWFLGTPDTFEKQARVMWITHHGLNVAAIFAGLGFLLGTTWGDLFGFAVTFGELRGRFLLAAFCFAFAGSRYFRSMLPG
ncbi:MAG: hypothetical protein U0P81_01385 [Holophagaceae bacterium]